MGKKSRSQSSGAGVAGAAVTPATASPTDVRARAAVASSEKPKCQEATESPVYGRAKVGDDVCFMRPEVVLLFIFVVLALYTMTARSPRLMKCYRLLYFSITCSMGATHKLSRVKRSLLGMLLVGGVALTDPLAWKEGFLVAMPDHKPLVAVVIMFVWLVWRRWASSGKQGLHPLVRGVGFIVLLAAATCVLPFNSTVTVYEVPFLTEAECSTVSAATAAAFSSPSFVPTQSRFDSATEVPLEDMSSEVSTMILEAFRQRVIPFVSMEYGGEGIVTLDEESVYVEHYQPYHEPAPVPHLRPQQLAVRVELTPPESKYVGGGGCVVGSMGRTVTPGLGSALVLPAKLWHGSSELGAGERSVLVGSFNVKGRDPWQRFVGMWRLWGLFSRKVRYIADRRLSSSGVDTMVTLEPVPEEIARSGDGSEVSPGDLKLEF